MLFHLAFRCLKRKLNIHFGERDLDESLNPRGLRGVDEPELSLAVDALNRVSLLS
jgi:hypothetical protein